MNEPRAETGPMRFEGDAAGILLRGDVAAGLAMQLAAARANGAAPSATRDVG